MQRCISSENSQKSLVEYASLFSWHRVYKTVTGLSFQQREQLCFSFQKKRSASMPLFDLFIHGYRLFNIMLLIVILSFCQDSHIICGCQKRWKIKYPLGTSKNVMYETERQRYGRYIIPEFVKAFQFFYISNYLQCLNILTIFTFQNFI